ncbi:hypothetical protein [Dankookia rubra]|uniref:hypothetical protein n=1 Tax=Dankookia rubra TaxID=1442381 RepID=UPI00140D4451|nr:hypothetical protein [Dankookia rubra]
MLAVAAAVSNPVSQDLGALDRFRDADRARQMTEMGAFQPDLPTWDLTRNN